MSLVQYDYGFDNGKTEKKTIEQSGVHKGSPMEGVGSMAGRI